MNGPKTQKKKKDLKILMFFHKRKFSMSDQALQINNSKLISRLFSMMLKIIIEKLTANFPELALRLYLDLILCINENDP